MAATTTPSGGAGTTPPGTGASTPPGGSAAPAGAARRAAAEPIRSRPSSKFLPLRFYSTALARSFELNPDSAAEAILAQALDTVDFPAVIESAYRDGVRIFLEIGPGASCTRMLDAILGSRQHPEGRLTIEATQPDTCWCSGGRLARVRQH